MMASLFRSTFYFICSFFLENVSAEEKVVFITLRFATWQKIYIFSDKIFSLGLFSSC